MKREPMDKIIIGGKSAEEKNFTNIKEDLSNAMGWLKLPGRSGKAPVTQDV